MSTDEEQKQDKIETSTTEQFKAPQNWGETVERTPDSVTRYRTLWRRMGALWIDAGILIVPMFLISLAVNASFMAAGTLTNMLLSELLNLVWSVLFIGWTGTTPGKWMFGLRVVPLDETQPVGFRRAVLRELLTVVTIVLYFAVFLSYGIQGQLAETDRLMVRPFDHLFWAIVLVVLLLISCADTLTALISGRRRAIHDFIAGTVVVKAKVPSVGGAVLAVIAAVAFVFGYSWLLTVLRH